MDPLLKDMATLEPQSFLGDDNNTEAGNSVKRDKNFSITEDLLVCSSWSNANTDPAIGTETTQFWKKAHAYWILHKKPEYPLRNSSALMQRFSQIKTDVIKFCGFLALVPSTSGYSETDRILKAKEMFAESGKKESEGKKHTRGLNFKFEHCWNVLKDDQKWLQMIKKIEEKSKNPTKEPTHTNGIVALDNDDVSSTPVVTEIPVNTTLANTGRLKRKGKLLFNNSPLLDRIEKLHVLTEKFHNEDVVLLRDSKMKVDKLVEMKREEMDLQKESLGLKKAGLEIQMEQIEIEKAKLEMEKKKMESELNKADMDLALQEAEILKVDIFSLSDPDEVLFYQVMRKKIRAKYSEMM